MAAVVAAVLVVGACAADDPLADPEAAAEVPAADDTDTTAAADDGEGADEHAATDEGDETTVTLPPELAGLGASGASGRAGGWPTAEVRTVEPVGLSIPGLGVESAPITSVGVDGNGDMEVPEPTEVGWYGFGPAPGEAGSSVLAAHIAADGIDGVFRDLTLVRPGDRVDVELSDGTVVAFEIVGLEQYGKTELPFDEVFARHGAPRLALITCGGDFNPSLRSYDDNIVAYAVPV